MKKYENYKFFSWEYNPKVLLVGNGVTWNSEYSWPNVISATSKNAEKLSDNIPYSIQASIKESKDDILRHDNCYKYFKEKYKYKSFPIIDELVELDFDAILTTNYTYEIEQALYNDFVNRSDQWKQKQIKHAFEKANAKYIINDYYRFAKNGIEQDIWHIHGEARKKNSFVLTHDEYGHLIERIIRANSEHGIKFRENEMCPYTSWIDYFISSDLF